MAVRDGTLIGLAVPGIGLVPLDAELEGRGLPHAVADGWAQLPAGCFPPRPAGDLAEYLLVYTINEVT